MSLWLCSLASAQGLWVGEGPHAGSLPLDGARIVCGDGELERFVCEDLAADFARVGLKVNAAKPPIEIWLGSVGRHAGIDALVRAGRIEAPSCWECQLIELVPKPSPGVSAALVIAGRDRRGTAYGAYTLSQALGVSPWHWWADVTPLKRPRLRLALDAPLRDGPAVRWRGLFINDEDWGLFPWAAKTFEPEAGTIGPKTYEQVFKLLLRLKANLLWPAMHKVSGAFNADPRNAELAQRYGIVMGSSHAEPLLRNNVAEWTAPPELYNYATHPQLVRDYWTERLETNGRYDNLYTLGMRGIHDSAMQGARTTAEKQALLSRVIADQRELLARRVGNPAKLPQIFVPYKEVLDLMSTPPGLAVPDDVTLVWPDDNFGYIRRLPQGDERARPGGHGVYYHLSYLGAPLSYLWLDTTPPALVAEEMGRAFDAGASRVWVVNGGDIKPGEVGLSHFFDLAWRPDAVRAQGQAGYLRGLAARLFGAALADDIGALWDAAYRLNFERRPEHLKSPSGWAPERVQARLAAFHSLRLKLDAARERLQPAQREGFFQLVDYPLRAAALANERFFALEAGRAEAAWHADLRLKALTARYNAGRWAGILAEEPADSQWPRFRQPKPSLPAIDTSKLHAEADLDKAAADAFTPISAPPPQPATVTVPADDAWQPVAGFGRGDRTLRARRAGAALKLQAPAHAGPACLSVHVLPSYPGDGTSPWVLTLQLDGAAPATVALPRRDQDAAWARGVLDNRLTARWTVPAGPLAAKLTTPAADLLFDGTDLQDRPCPTP